MLQRPFTFGHKRGCPDAKTEVTSTVIAAILGVTARRVQQLAQDGILKADKGKYLLGGSVQRYIEYRVREKETTKAEQDRDDAEIRIKKARATVAELDAAELQGRIHCSEDVETMTEDLVYTARSGLMALPGRLAVDVAHAGSSVEASHIIRAEVHKLMASLASYRYDAQKYRERVRKRQKWEASREGSVR